MIHWYDSGFVFKQAFDKLKQINHHAADFIITEDIDACQKNHPSRVIKAFECDDFSIFCDYNV